MQTEGKMKTVLFLTESRYHFHHWEPTINRLTGAFFRLTRVLFRATLIFSLIRVQTFTAISESIPF